MVIFYYIAKITYSISRYFRKFELFMKIDGRWNDHFYSKTKSLQARVSTLAKLKVRVESRLTNSCLSLLEIQVGTVEVCSK